MTIANYTRVQLRTNRFQNEGVSSGAIGYVIEVYGEDAYEVEFSDGDGVTIAQVVVRAEEIEAAETSGLAKSETERAA